MYINKEFRDYYIQFKILDETFKGFYLSRKTLYRCNNIRTKKAAYNFLNKLKNRRIIRIEYYHSWGQLELHIGGILFHSSKLYDMNSEENLHLIRELQRNFIIMSNHPLWSSRLRSKGGN